MNKTALIVLLTLLPSLAFAAGVGVHLDAAPIDTSDRDSIKRGAKHFADYCMSCHSASLMRYNRIATDLGMDEDELRKTMVFSRDKKGGPTKIGELIKVAMTDDYAKQAFGGKVPDLSLIARSRGSDWLYTYLRKFYIDPERPMGANNLVFPEVGMPHVLWELQGWQKPVYKTIEHDGVETKVVEHLELVKPGKLSVSDYDVFVGELVNFMVYLAEPIQNERKSLGWKVLLFLAVFAVFAYLLKKEYWKDIH